MEPYVEEFRAVDGVMHVRLQGTFPNGRLAIEKNLYQPLIEACGNSHCCDAIVDARALRVGFDTMALFRAGVDAASLNKFGLRVALVARKDMVSSFFDDVIRNRGARVEVFTDMEGANNWIEELRAEDSGRAREPDLPGARPR
jgi:hypothetical protein